MNIKYSSAIACAVAGSILSSSAMATEAPARSETIGRQQLGVWLNRYFRDIAVSCGARDENNRQYVPVGVRNSVILQPMWTSEVNTSYLESLDSQFSQVRIRSGSAWTPVGTPIALPWSRPGAPIVYQLQTNSMIEHNCTTLLAAQGQGGVNFRFLSGGLDANLRASMTSQAAITAYFYHGTMISPIAAVFNDGRVSRFPENLSPFSIMTAIWSWYRSNPDRIDAGERGELRIIQDMQAIAAYRVLGLTQTSMLRGAASLNAGFLVFSANGETVYERSNEFRNNNNLFSIAYWSESDRALPRLSDIVQGLQPLIANQIRPATTESRTIENDGAIMFDWDVPNLTRSLCLDGVWASAAQTNTGATNLASISSFSLEWRDGTCRFKVQYLPPVAAANQARLALSVRSTIPAPATAGSALTLTSNHVEIPDYRRSFGLDPEGRHRSIEFASSTSGIPAEALTLTFPIREQHPTRRVNRAEWETLSGVTCGQAAAIPLQRPALPVTRVDSAGTLSMTLQVPSSVVAGANAGDRRSCSISGKVWLYVDGGQRFGVDLPSQPFDAIVRAAAPPRGNAIPVPGTGTVPVAEPTIPAQGAAPTP